MSYYKGNALYSHLEKNPSDKFDFVTGNMWQLVYGDNNCNPKLLVLVIGKPSQNYGEPLSEEELAAFEQLRKLSETSGIPIKIVVFDSQSTSVEGVTVLNSPAEEGVKMSMKELSEMFAGFGLPVSNTQTAKYLNDMTSSAYHNWQRSSLGRDLTVSDIDLWKLNEDNSINSIYELKRSYIPLERWNPYPDDYRNFKLISNLANKSGIDFKIVYNVREKNPFKDDVSRVKLFNVNFSKNPSIVSEGIYELNSFLNKA